MLSTYQPLPNIENGNQNYPWAQEIFLVMHGFGWTNCAEINSRTARALGIQDGEMVWAESPFNRIKVRARVSEDGRIIPGTLSFSPASYGAKNEDTTQKGG